MAETDNIAKLADYVAKNVFARFLWQTTGARNQNWPCEREIHKRKTHPSDIVFYYDEPYSLTRTYVNCDLKSYATGTISPGVILSALESLAASLSCAEISSTWRDMYIHEGFSPSIVGMLFVYNHDGEYDSSFDQILSLIKHDKVRVPKGSQVIILGPQQVRWLDNVRFEIVHMRGLEELPPEQHCRFEYPHLVRKKKVQVQRARAATLEMLTGPWITLAYDAVGNKEPGILVFYGREGNNVQEFLYLIDYLLHYQMLKPGVEVRIRTLEPAPNSAAVFERAISEYIGNYHGGEEIADLLRKIDYKQMDTVHRSFSQIEVGMRNA